MYTVVLMAALTAGSATPDFHPRGGVAHGCAGGLYSCFGCYGGGGAYPPYGGNCIGTYGGYAISGPTAAYGCWGGWSSNSNLTVYSTPGTYGYGTGVNGGSAVNYGPNYGLSFQCHGCYGCYGGWSCYGSPSSVAGYATTSPEGNVPPVVVVPAPNVPAPGVIPVPQPLPKKEEAKVRSKVIIEVAENAKLFVDDNLMTGTGVQRVFQTPPLSPDQTYYYEIRVEVMNKGKVLTDSQRIVIHPGETVTAAFREGVRPDVVTVRNAVSAP